MNADLAGKALCHRPDGIADVLRQRAPIGIAQHEELRPRVARRLQGFHRIARGWRA